MSKVTRIRHQASEAEAFQTCHKAISAFAQYDGTSTEQSLNGGA